MGMSAGSKCRTTILVPCQASETHLKIGHLYIDGLVQNWSNPIANAQELMQSCTKPSIWSSSQNELWWLDLKMGHHHNSLDNGRQGPIVFK